MRRARLKFLSDFSAESGELLLSYANRKRTVYSKGGRDVVTSADRAVDALLARRLAGAGFKDSVLSEESAGALSSSGYRWIIDPVDGTSNFAHGSPLFCTSLALELDGKIVAGAVNAPILQEFFYAERGKGAFLNGRRIHASKAGRLYDLVVAVERQPNARHALQSLKTEIPIARGNRLRTLGSAALDLCYVASGRFDAFFCTSIYAWDVAAAGLIVEEAGGRASMLGLKKEFSRRPFGYAASNKAVHPSLLKALR
ncbi:MAG: inositol monophosphatase family protein [Candidatus Micrarchaeota archaeon]